MEIFLKQLVLKNFKGIKERTIDFGKITNISAENGLGKTTIFDGFCWLLFGKDSKNVSNFKIQTLDKQGNVLHGLEHSVSAILEIDGVDKTLNRTFAENWVKKRGESEKELKGCSTDFEVDGIPVKQKEYQTVISDLINEDLFKMVTNPLFFPSMNWQDQRKILLDIIGDLEEETVINYNTKLSPLRSLLTDGIDNFNKRVKASINKLKDQVKSLPYRIDECNNSIVEVDTEALEFQKRGIIAGINSIDEQIADSSKANEEKLKLQDKLFELKDKQRKLILNAAEELDKPLIELKSKIQGRESQIRKYAIEIEDLEDSKSKLLKTIERNKYHIDETKIEQQELREKWTLENSIMFEFDMNKSACPMCRREYELERVEEIRIDSQSFFDKVKTNKLESISSKGKELGLSLSTFELCIKDRNEQIITIDKEIQTLNEKIEDVKAELFDLVKEKEQFNNVTEISIPGVEELEKEIMLIQADIEGFKSADNNTLKTKKVALQGDLEDTNRQLGAKDNNEKMKVRILELESEEKDLNVKIAELEGQQYLGEEFIRTKVELLEGEINKKFGGIVSFKLFDSQVNGGLKECCEALVNGIPFNNNANTAGCLNAGLTIINTLSQHYNVNAPIFIDNRESVNKIIESKSQIINLKVSTDKLLKVEVQE